MPHLRGDRQRTILIVDDDPLFTLLAAETLRSAGFAPQVADNAHEALQRMHEMKPDLVLLDVELPDGQGFDVCVQIRLLPDGIDIPIVMVTGKHDTESIARPMRSARPTSSASRCFGHAGHRIEFILRAHDTMRRAARQRDKEPRDAAGVAGRDLYLGRIRRHRRSDHGRLQGGRGTPRCRRRRPLPRARSSANDICPARSPRTSSKCPAARAPASSRRACSRSSMARSDHHRDISERKAAAVAHRVSGVLRHLTACRTGRC